MKIACVQTNPRLGELSLNRDEVVARIAELGAASVDLAVFPECALTGYAVASREAAEAIAIPSDHAALDRVESAARAAGLVAVVGYAEREGDHLYNAAAVLGLPTRGRYRKTHLPYLGFDRWATPGDELPVFEARWGRFGVLICFDLRIPEAARSLALAGAEVIVLPTNWPEGAELSAGAISLARAAENRAFLATCDRVGEEGGFRFIGGSKIVSPDGAILAGAGAELGTISAEIEPSEARTKRRVVIPGAYETDVFMTRRPELYGPLIKQ